VTIACGEGVQGLMIDNAARAVILNRDEACVLDYQLDLSVKTTKSFFTCQGA
jgi:hypothetical protein